MIQKVKQISQAPKHRQLRNTKRNRLRIEYIAKHIIASRGCVYVTTSTQQTSSSTINRVCTLSKDENTFHTQEDKSHLVVE